MVIKIRDNMIELKKKKSEYERYLDIFCISLILFFVIFMTLKLFFFITVTVDGSSMNNTLHDEEQVMVNLVKSPKRGDIVVFYDAWVDENGQIVYRYNADGSKRLLIKRVIADEGDTVYWKDGNVYISYENDYGDYYVKLNEPYLSVPSSTYSGIFNSSDNTSGTVVDEGCFFAMGDNRRVSSDSRSRGPIDKRLLLGVVTEFSVEKNDSFINKFLCKIF